MRKFEIDDFVLWQLFILYVAVLDHAPFQVIRSHLIVLDLIVELELVSRFSSKVGVVAQLKLTLPFLHVFVYIKKHRFNGRSIRDRFRQIKRL